jgi:hypothetical protein
VNILFRFALFIVVVLTPSVQAFAAVDSSNLRIVTIDAVESPIPIAVSDKVDIYTDQKSIDNSVVVYQKSGNFSASTT